MIFGLATCEPNTCGVGECTATGSGEFECSCPTGVFGTRCEIGEINSHQLNIHVCIEIRNVNKLLILKFPTSKTWQSLFLYCRSMFTYALFKQWYMHKCKRNRIQLFLLNWFPRRSLWKRYKLNWNLKERTNSSK